MNVQEAAPAAAATAIGQAVDQEAIDGLAEEIDWFFAELAAVSGVPAAGPDALAVGVLAAP